MVSIAIDIAYTSPRTFPVCAAIISKLLTTLDTKNDRVEVIRKIYRKLSQLPNTGHMEVWLQRISHSLEPKLAYKEHLCLLVKNRAADIWNNDWITSTKLKAALDPSQIVSKSKLRSLKPVIKPIEIAFFPASWY